MTYVTVSKHTIRTRSIMFTLSSVCCDVITDVYPLFFFFVTATDTNAGDRPVRADAAWYAKSIVVNVRLRTDGSKGKIYLPYIAVEYGSMTSEDYDNNKGVAVSILVCS